MLSVYRKQPKTRLRASALGVLILSFAILGCGLASGQTSAPSDQKQAQHNQEIALGVYDPDGDFDSARWIAWQHLYVRWPAIDFRDLQAQIEASRVRQRRLLLTIEPFTSEANGPGNAERLLRDVVEGSFDDLIDRLCQVAAGDRSLISWGHSMDDRNGRYPWANRDPQEFVAAFRHFVERCRKQAPGAQFVWSPNADGDVAPYFPGRPYVDYVGLHVFGLEAADQKAGVTATFEGILRAKYDRLKQFDRPILVTQSGVSGSDQYMMRWIGQGPSDLPPLQAFIYFNGRDRYQWPGFGTPDWRRGARMLQRLR
jgi:endoglucanase